MAKKKYGVSWWGQQWLNSLTLIDYSNRLPQGRAIASTGKVRSIDVKGNQINAKVQGTQTAPFRVGISVPLFTADEKQRFIDAIAQNPAFIEKINNRELPQELLQIAESQRIRIFPESWKDFSLHCSCPDLAEPCEHMAAVIYEVAEEIDKNPFMVFEVHELHFAKELEGYNSRLVTKKSGETTEVDSLMKRLPQPGDRFNPTEPEPEPTKPQVFLNIDFTNFPEVGSHLVQLFRKQAIFEEINVREVVRECFECAATAAGKLLRGDFPPPELTGRIVQGDRLQLVLDGHLLPEKLLAWDEKNEPVPLKAAELLHLLLDYELEAQGQTHPTITALLGVLSFSLNIAKKGAILPQLLACSPGMYRVRWVPALMVEEVKAVFEQLAAALPHDLLVVEKNGVLYSQSPTETLKSLCAVFIGECVREGAEADPHPMVQMFEGVPGESIQSIDNQEVAQSLQRWLNHFYPPKKEYAPLLKVEDLHGKYVVELMVEHRPAPLVPPVSFSQFSHQKRFENIKADVLKDIGLLADFYPQINNIVDSEGKKHLTYNSTRFVGVLHDTLPVLTLFGIKIILPPGMRQVVQPKMALLAKRSSRKKSEGPGQLEDSVAFDWQIALGDEIISVKAFEELVKHDNGVVKWHNRYVLIDEDDLIDLFEKIEEPPRPGGIKLLQALLSEEYEGMKLSISPDVTALLREYTQSAKMRLPRGLTGEMYLHQLFAYDWILKNARLGFGSLLADDLGLGKTLPAIATLLKFKEEGRLEINKALVVVPTAQHVNWLREIERFAPKLKAAVYEGQERPMGVADPDIIITAYRTVRDEAELLRKMSWYCIILDEAQRIKNPYTELTRSVKALPSEVRIALCSVEVESSLGSLWSLLDFTNPGYLGTWQQFTKQFIHPIRLDNDRRRAIFLKKITAPLMLRRRKSDKLDLADMPKRIEHRQYAPLIPEQAALYQNLAAQGLRAVFDEKDGQRRQAVALKLLIALKQVCNHPYQYLKKGSTIPDLSGKAELLFCLLDNIYENGEKALVLTQFQETGELLVRFIQDEFGKRPLFLHGGAGRPEREEMLETFRQNPDVDTLILSIKSGNSEFDFAAASHLIHFDSWWNPALEALATRIGLSEELMTWRLITEGSLEEKIDDMLRQRNDLANLTAAAGENWLGNLSDKELGELVAI